MDVVAVVGLDYVGSPPSVAFGKIMPTIGYALAVIFDRMGLDTLEMPEATGIKWNSLHFRPGLVGSHYIEVDPYYLTYKAEMLGYHPKVIAAGRSIKIGMDKYFPEQTVKLMILAGSSITGAKVNVLGTTFQEDVQDLRCSRVWDLIAELRACGVEVFVLDPAADARETLRKYGVALSWWGALPQADAIVAAVTRRAVLSRHELVFEICALQFGVCAGTVIPPLQKQGVTTRL